MDRYRPALGLLSALAALCGCGVAASTRAVPVREAGTGDAAAVETIGHSVRGRPIEVRRLGEEASPTRVLVVGEIHGNEAAGRAVTKALELEAPPDGVELWTIRTVNPDGHVRGTRQNARGVDLNRNFPRRWRQHGEPSSPYYPGPRPLSEPESRAAARLIRRVEPDVTVWYHQPLELVYESPGADVGLVRRYAKVADLPSEPPPRLSGTATRWQNHRDPDSSAFVVELGADRLSAEQVRVHVRAVRAVSGRAAAR